MFEQMTKEVTYEDGRIMFTLSSPDRLVRYEESIPRNPSVTPMAELVMVRKHRVSSCDAYYPEYREGAFEGKAYVTVKTSEILTRTYRSQDGIFHHLYLAWLGNQL